MTTANPQTRATPRRIPPLFSPGLLISAIVGLMILAMSYTFAERAGWFGTAPGKELIEVPRDDPDPMRKFAFVAQPTEKHDYNATDAHIGTWVLQEPNRIIRMTLDVDSGLMTTVQLRAKGSLSYRGGAYVIKGDTIEFRDSDDRHSQHGTSQIVASDANHLVLRNPETGESATFAKEIRK